MFASNGGMVAFRSCPKEQEIEETVSKLIAISGVGDGEEVLSVICTSSQE